MSAPIPIIIPVYGKLNLTGHCLESIWRHARQISYQIVLVEDGSDEPVSLEWLKTQELYPADNPPIVLVHERNQGFTRAINTGIIYALARLGEWPFMVLLNNDTEVQTGWLGALSDTVTLGKNVGVVGAKLLSMTDPDQILHGGTLDLLGTHKGGRESERHCKKRTDEVWVTGACMAITREAVLHCGLFDQGYENFCSDSDYCLTVKSRGYRVVYQPECRVYHIQNATVSGKVDASRLMRDQQRLLDKWGGKMLQDWIKELPLGLSRGQGPGR